jgi:hypothetical protein
MLHYPAGRRIMGTCGTQPLGGVEEAPDRFSIVLIPRVILGPKSPDQRGDTSRPVSRRDPGLLADPIVQFLEQRQITGPRRGFCQLRNDERPEGNVDAVKSDEPGGPGDVVVAERVVQECQGPVGGRDVKLHVP